MKALFLTTLTLVIMSSASFASSSDELKVYKFEVTFLNKKFIHQESSGSWATAYENAAKACFNFFKSPTLIASGQGEQLINACGNPRTL